MNAIAFSSDGRYLASAGDDHTIRLWDIVAGSEAAKIVSPGRVTAVDLHPWRPLVACGDAGGNVIVAEIEGITYEAVVVTARRDSSLSIRCPACHDEQAISATSVGTTLSCRDRQCGLPLRLNRFILDWRPVRRHWSLRSLWFASHVLFGLAIGAPIVGAVAATGIDVAGLTRGSPLWPLFGLLVVWLLGWLTSPVYVDPTPSIRRVASVTVGATLTLWLAMWPMISNQALWSNWRVAVLAIALGLITGSVIAVLPSPAAGLLRWLMSQDLSLMIAAPLAAVAIAHIASWLVEGLGLGFWAGLLTFVAAVVCLVAVGGLVWAFTAVLMIGELDQTGRWLSACFWIGILVGSVLGLTVGFWSVLAAAFAGLTGAIASQPLSQSLGQRPSGWLVTVQLLAGAVGVALAYWPAVR